MRHAAKRDDVEPAIVQALELAGWTVIKVSDEGFPDLVCLRRGVIRLLECKGPGKGLTLAQQKAFPRIEAGGVPVHVVHTPAEALLAVAQGVESELGHRPDWGVGVLEEMKGLLAESERLMGPTSRHAVTPAYQRAQTDAVLPKRREK